MQDQKSTREATIAAVASEIDRAWRRGWYSGLEFALSECQHAGSLDEVKEALVETLQECDGETAA